MEFWTYYRVLRRRRWLIVATILVAVAVVLAVDRPSVGDYAATATLSIPSAQRFFFVAGAGVPAPEQNASSWPSSRRTPPIWPSPRVSKYRNSQPTFNATTLCSRRSTRD